MFQFFYNAYAGCGADAGYAQLDHAQSGIQSADAAGRLDLYLVADAFFHQRHILKGCAAGAKARGRLYEIRADLDVYKRQTWICAAAGTDNIPTIKDVMYSLTCDADIMTKITEDT